MCHPFCVCWKALLDSEKAYYVFSLFPSETDYLRFKARHKLLTEVIFNTPACSVLLKMSPETAWQRLASWTFAHQSVLVPWLPLHRSRGGCRIVSTAYVFPQYLSLFSFTCFSYLFLPFFHCLTVLEQLYICGLHP